MDDLLQLLLSEFDLDVPTAQAALEAAASEPENAHLHLVEVIDFLNRSLQASEVAGLEGLSQWLQCVMQVATSTTETHDPAMLAWLCGWIAPARSYLERPAQPETVAQMTVYLVACPNEEVQALAPMLEEVLAVAPQNLDEYENTEPDIVTADDVSLVSDDADPGLLAAMLQDAPEQLERLRGYIEQISQGTATSMSLIEAQRIAHTLKGSGNIVGIVGIGKVAHFLENVMEWALVCVQTGEPINPLATRDMALSVETLQQMVGYLHGEEAAPEHALPVLQRLAQWSYAVKTRGAAEFAPEAINIEHNVPREDAQEESTQADAIAGGVSSHAVSAQTVRVDVDRLSRLLRRAGQSLFISQRMAQFLSNSRAELRAALDKQRELEARLREMQGYVDRQVVNFRAQRDAGVELDPLEMDRYDTMHSLSRFIAEDIRDQHELSMQAMHIIERAQDTLREEQSQLTDQHRDLISARMIAVKSIVPRLRRNVQQTASSTGKTVELSVTGEHTAIDANILTRLTEPLLHLVRNAVDHGIESPHRREAANKSTVGNVRIGFRAVGQEVEVVCADDGGGLDAYAIHQKAIEYGLVSDNEPLTLEQIYSLILLPGFSTKAEITEISGRGVGLDVVNDRVIAMKGRVSISSTPGEGTQFTLRVPQSLGAAHVLVVDVANQRVAIPIENIERALAPDQVFVEKDVMTLDDERFMAVRLADHLGYVADQPASRHPSAVIVRVDQQRRAYLVDHIVDSREVVLQDAGALLRRIPGVAAATLREDGQAMLILDMVGLMAASGTEAKRAASAKLRKRAASERTRVMVVDDAYSVRRAMTQLLEDAGFDVVACKDGQDAVDQLREKVPAIILTDMEMPTMNGVELTQRVRENISWQQLPVVMITSRASDKHRQIAQAAGVDVFLTKPFNDADLLGHVRALTRSQKQATTDVMDAQVESLKQ